jgi:Tol biopolymer transport system component
LATAAPRRCGGRGPSIAISAIAIALLVSGWPATALAGDPSRRWRTVETEHFVVHYPVPLDAIGRRVGVVAERAHRTLAPALGHEPTEKTLIIVIDDVDSANGFANVIPRNAITVFATAPPGFSSLGDHDDWLYGLVAHEYTHILHLDTMAGLPRIYNSIFGKTWAPNQVLPRWLIEGIATYEESKRSSGGRTRNSEFDALLRMSVLQGKPLRIDQINGAPRLFPRGNIAYLHGSSFLRYVFDRFGDDALARMSQANGEYPIPFAINRQILEAVGKSFPELYDDWTRYLGDRYSLQAMAVERRGLRQGRALTRTGEVNVRPRYSSDGKQLLWFASDGRALARLREMPVGGDAGQSREVADLPGLGNYQVVGANDVVYEQARVYDDQYQFQDLFLWNRQTRQTVQLTRRRRARDPAVSPDGRAIAYSQNQSSSSVLAIMPLVVDGEAEIVWRGGRFDQAYQPAWSPDGRTLAFSAWRTGGFRDILLLDLATRKVAAVTHDRALDSSPTFSSDGRWLYFDSDRTGISNIYAFDLEQRSLWQVTDQLGSAYEPAVSPDGTRLAYRSAGSNGYDLYEMTVDPSQWRRAVPYLDDRPAPVAISDDETAVSAPRDYRALDTLAPLNWTYEMGGTTKGSYTTVRTGGADAAGLHSYSVAVGMGLPRADVNVAGSYAYFGLRPGLRVSASRTLSERNGFRIDGKNQPYREEVLSGSVALGVPSQRRPESSWFLSLDYSADWSRLVERPDDRPDPNAITTREPLTDYVRSSVGVRLTYSELDGTVNGIGPQDGVDLSLSTRLELPELGATYRALTVSYAGRWFEQLPWRGVPSLAVRLAGSIRAGELVRASGFALGGLPSQDLVSALINSTRVGSTGFLRGYPARAVAGNQFHLLNSEVRQLVWNLERGLTTLPIYLQRLHAAALWDVAAAWDGEFSTAAVRTSMGAALRLDAVFGYVVAGTLELGTSVGLTDTGIHESWLLLTGTL